MVSARVWCPGEAGHVRATTEDCAPAWMAIRKLKPSPSSRAAALATEPSFSRFEYSEGFRNPISLIHSSVEKGSSVWPPPQSSGRLLRTLERMDLWESVSVLCVFAHVNRHGRYLGAFCPICPCAQPVEDPKPGIQPEPPSCPCRIQNLQATRHAHGGFAIRGAETPGDPCATVSAAALLWTFRETTPPSIGSQRKTDWTPELGHSQRNLSENRTSTGKPEPLMCQCSLTPQAVNSSLFGLL